MADDPIRRELELLRDLGFTHLDVPANATLAGASPAKVKRQDAAPSAARVTAAAPAIPLPSAGEMHTLDWDELETRALACTRCKLAAGRQTVVFGQGNRNADLMFIGEAPGHDEDVQGLPFVGRAGQLLTDIIKAMRLAREEVYIGNVIKCRPPGNRNPESDEIAACSPFIRRQIELVRPRVIVTLGKFAFQTTMQTEAPISSVRGQWHRYGDIPLMPTYHPAYLLRTPGAKKDVWQDMKQVMAELGIT